MLRGCLTVGGVVLGLAVIGFVYLSLNPPLKPPDTGYLSRTTEVEARLDPATPTAAFEVRFGASEHVYSGAYGEFPPLRLEASLVRDSTNPGEVRLWLFPRDGLPVAGLATGNDSTRLSWEADCQTPGTVSGCARAAVLVVAGAGVPASGAVARVRLFAEQRFPVHVPTPFLVSLDLAANRMEDVSGGLTAAAVEGSDRVSPGRPVVRWSLGVERAEASIGGSWLTVQADHDGVAIPAGFEAPPPVGFALVNEAGEVVASAEVRAGSPEMLALPPLDGAYTVVGWWQDRAANSYDVRWRVEQATGSDDEPWLSALLSDGVWPVERLEGSGDFRTDEDVGEGPISFAPFETDSSPYLGPDHLPSHLAVVELQLTARTDEAGPVVLRLDGAPVPLVSGATVDTAFGELVNCSGYPCESGVPVAGDFDQPSVNVEWEGSVTLWPLDPSIGPEP